MTYTIHVTWPNGCTERAIPTTASDGLGIIQQGMIIKATEIVPDQDDPANTAKRWAHLMDSRYIAVDYPNNKGPQSRATVTDDGGEPIPPPPTPGAGTVTADVALNINGDIYRGNVILKEQ